MWEGGKDEKGRGDALGFVENIPLGKALALLSQQAKYRRCLRFEQITSNFFTALHKGNYSSITPADFAMGNVPPQALPHIFKINR